MIINFFLAYRKYPFWANLYQKFKNYLFKVKSGSWTNFPTMVIQW